MLDGMTPPEKSSYCFRVRVRMFMCICIYVRVRMCMCICMCVLTCVRVRICMCVRMCSVSVKCTLRGHAYIHKPVCMCTCLYVDLQLMDACMQGLVQIYIYTMGKAYACVVCMQGHK